MTRLTVAALVLCVGCSTTAPQDYEHITIDRTKLAEAAAVGPDDVFEVRVHGHDDLTGVHRVSASGHIDFPLIGRVAVQGLTSTQIADAIRGRLLDGYLRAPVVTVYVKERHSKKVFVLGQVAKPGAFIFEKNMSIVQAIAMAGGFTPVAQANYTIVTRVDNGQERRIPVPVEKIITDKSASNFVLQPGDIVFVPESIM